MLLDYPHTLQVAAAFGRAESAGYRTGGFPARRLPPGDSRLLLLRTLGGRNPNNCTVSCRRRFWGSSPGGRYALPRGSGETATLPVASGTAGGGRSSVETTRMLKMLSTRCVCRRSGGTEFFLSDAGNLPTQLVAMCSWVLLRSGSSSPGQTLLPGQDSSSFRCCFDDRLRLVNPLAGGSELLS